jgi:hypothetical protein
MHSGSIEGSPKAGPQMCNSKTISFHVQSDVVVLQLCWSEPLLNSEFALTELWHVIVYHRRLPNLYRLRSTPLHLPSIGTYLIDQSYVPNFAHYGTS